MDLNDIVLYAHLASLAVAACAIVVADLKGSAWIRGKVQTISADTMHKLHITVSLSLTALILTGLYLFWPMREFLLQQPFFMLKLCFVAALVLNSLLIDWLMGAATKIPFSQISNQGRMLMYAAGAISTLAWVGTVVFAFLQFKLAPFGIYL